MNQYKTKIQPWNNPKIRSGFFQVLILSLVFWGGWILFQNTVNNLETRGISSGFAFLKERAGFDISTTLIPYSPESSNMRVFWVGLLNTLSVSILSIITATILGVIIGVSRLSKNWIVSKIATVYIEIFRNVPLLLQIFFWYFAVLRTLPKVRDAAKNGFFNDSVFISNRGLNLPKPIYESGASLIFIALAIGIIGSIFYKIYAKKKQQETGEQKPVLVISLTLVLALPTLVFFLSGMPISFEYPALKGFNFRGGMTITPEISALWLSLSMYTASFIAENVRSGIMSVNYGQTEAAHSLAIGNSKTLRLIIIPQALRVIIPPVSSQYLSLAKNSSLATAIAYPDLVSVFTGTVLNNVGQALEVVAITMVAYLTISLSISYFMNWYNSRIALVER